MKKGRIFSVLIVIIPITISITGCFSADDDNNDDENSWGEEGELTIPLSIDKTSMEINSSINITEKIRNNGSSKIRVVIPLSSQLKLYDSNNNSVNWIGPNEKPPEPPTNDDLKILKPEENLSYIHIITNDLWELKQNETFRCIVHYYMSEQSGVTLPFWKGEIWSNEVFFKVT